MTYGLTESCSNVVLDGRPLPGVELRVVDGEVQVRGEMLMRAYRDGTSPITSDGWLPTGDAGEIRADGTLDVHGRRGDLIITGGENVWPTPIETMLQGMRRGGGGGGDRPTRRRVGPGGHGRRRARRRQPTRPCSTSCAPR